MKKKIITIIVVVLLVAIAFVVGRVTKKSQEFSSESYRLTYTLLDYEDKVTYVIGHKNPDMDSVMSAIAFADFLNLLGIKAEARITSDVNNETQYILDTFGIETPEILGNNAEGCQLWLVDHSETAQMVDGAENARIVGITDHHGIGDAENEEQINVRSARYGSTTAEIYCLYKECGLEISTETAKVLLAGLLSDTSYLMNEDNILNRGIYDELLKKSGVKNVDELILGMKNAKLDLSGKTDEEIFSNDHKDYEENGTKYGISNIKVLTINDINDMASRMEAVADESIKSSEQDYLFYYVYDFDYSTGYLGCVGPSPEKVKSLLNEAFGDDYEVIENYVIMSPSVSRKEVLVPRINEALN